MRNWWQRSGLSSGASAIRSRNCSFTWPRSDDRKIHLAAGFPSSYVYCVEELQLSEYEAYSRIEVARAAAPS